MRYWQVCSEECYEFSSVYWAFVCNFRHAEGKWEGMGSQGGSVLTDGAVWVLGFFGMSDILTLGKIKSTVYGLV